jgi:hypothetical protein
MRGLPDGSRVNAIIPPLAVDGPLLSIRRFPSDRLKAEDLVGYKAIHHEHARVPAPLRQPEAERARQRRYRGAGKTTLLNVLSSFISNSERIVTVEDAAELQLQQPHVARSKPGLPTSKVKARSASGSSVVNCLRMRPDRIIVGEVRGEEALDMLQAMNTGHDGSLTTIHANTPRDALGRLETMIAMANVNLPDKAMRAARLSPRSDCRAAGAYERRHQKSDEHLGDHRNGRRHHHHAGDFQVRKLGIGPDGKVLGRFSPPACAESLRALKPRASRCRRHVRRRGRGAVMPSKSRHLMFVRRQPRSSASSC